MKLIWPLVATLLYCAGVQSSAPSQHHQLTQEQKNEKLFNLIVDRSDTPEKYKCIEILKALGARVDRKDIGLAIYWEDAELVNRLLYYDTNPDAFPATESFIGAHKNIEIMKLLAGDRRFDIASGAEGALAKKIMSSALDSKYKETVLLLRCMGLDATIADKLSIRNSILNLRYWRYCEGLELLSSKESEEILAIVTAPADKLHTFMTPDQREEFAAIKAKRNQNQLQFVLNRQMGLHQQQLQERRKRVAAIKPVSEQTS